MKIYLKEFQTEDYQKLISWVESPEFLLQWAGSIFQYPLTVEQLDNYRSNMLKVKPTRKIYSVFESESNNHVGHIELGTIDLINNSARMGRVLIGDKNTKGKGYGKEIVKAVLKVGFEELKLHRIDLGVFDFNKAAIKCYESVGFTHEGVSRESRKMGSEYWNLLQMGILKTEYRDILSQ